MVHHAVAGDDDEHAHEDEHSGGDGGATSAYIVHGSGMLTLWALLSLSGVIVARYFRHRPWWLYVHVRLQKLSFICVLPAALVGAYASSRMHKDDGITAQLEGSYHKFPAETTGQTIHLVLGPIITGLTILQGMMGKLRLHDISICGCYDLSYTDEQRDRIGVVHAILGKVLLALAMAQVFTGAACLFSGDREEVEATFYAYFGVVFCIFLGLEVFLLPYKKRLPLVTAFVKAKAIDDEIWTGFQRRVPRFVSQVTARVFHPYFLRANNNVAETLSETGASPAVTSRSTTSRRATAPDSPGGYPDTMWVSMKVRPAKQPFTPVMATDC